MARLPGRDEIPPLLLIFGLALAAEVATTLIGVRAADIPLSNLGVYFDGHFYIEIAKSFPIPYAIEGRGYMGQAPGYPAAIYLARLLSGGLLDYGTLATLMAWIPASLAASVFYLLCRQVGAPPLAGALLFLAANPRWVALGATPHPEPLAVCLAMLCLLAHLRGARGGSMLWLSLAVLTRFPAILLLLPLALDALLRPPGRGWRGAVLLSAPLLALGLFELQFRLRFPGFPGITAVHGLFWDARWTWPFASFLAQLDALGSQPRLSWLELGFASALFYLLSLIVGVRRDRTSLLLGGWVALIVLFHASLDGPPRIFPRMAILAWPAALLLVWMRVGHRVPQAAAAVLAGALLVFGVTLASGQIPGAVALQRRGQHYLEETIRRLDSDEPHWVDFPRYRQERQRERQRRRRRGISDPDAVR